MNIEKLTYFKERLLEEKRRIELELSESNRFGFDEALTDSVKELSGYDNHPADLGSETFEREKDLALKSNLVEIYQRVNEALERLENDQYGVCEDCGQAISLERLEALPYTTLCISCQQEEEDKHLSRERPIEEEFLSPGFGRTFLDHTDNVGFDGEDTWQAVARYGTSESPSDLGGVLSYNDMYIDSDEPIGTVEEFERIMATDPDEIPPDPENE